MPYRVGDADEVVVAALRVGAAVREGGLQVVRGAHVTRVEGADDVAVLIVGKVGECGLCCRGRAFVVFFLDVGELREDGGRPALRVGLHVRGGVEQPVGVECLAVRVAGAVLGQRAGEQAAAHVPVGAVLVSHRAAHGVAGTGVAVLGHHAAEAEELALQPVVASLLVAEGGQTRVGTVTREPVEHRGAGQHPAALLHVGGVARSGVVQVDTGAHRPADRAQQVGAAGLVDRDEEFVVPGGLDVVG